MGKKNIYILSCMLVITLLAGFSFVSASVDCIDHSLTVGRAIMGNGIVEEKIINKMVCFRW